MSSMQYFILGMLTIILAVITGFIIGFLYWLYSVHKVKKDYERKFKQEVTNAKENISEKIGRKIYDFRQKFRRGSKSDTTPRRTEITSSKAEPRERDPFKNIGKRPDGFPSERISYDSSKAREHKPVIKEPVREASRNKKSDIERKPKGNKRNTKKDWEDFD